jgi:hypothetical protein
MAVNKSLIRNNPYQLVCGAAAAVAENHLMPGAKQQAQNNCKIIRHQGRGGRL